MKSQWETLHFVDYARVGDLSERLQGSVLATYCTHQVTRNDRNEERGATGSDRCRKRSSLSL